MTGLLARGRQKRKKLRKFGPKGGTGGCETKEGQYPLLEKECLQLYHLKATKVEKNHPVMREKETQNYKASNKVGVLCASRLIEWRED